MLIRKIKEDEAGLLSQLWLRTSILTHDFIPVSHWKNHVSDMENIYLQKSEVYVAEEQNQVVGFIALVENHLAAFFVDSNQQGKGIGSLLLKQAKEVRPSLTLNVYQKNHNSVQCYLAKKFKIIDNSKDELTGELEDMMQWNA